MSNYQYTKDEYNKNLLLDKNTGYQVMMEWEKEYMQDLIKKLNPFGDVLEIGFGLGISANFIQKYNIKSHTIIECNPTVIEKLKKWAKKLAEATGDSTLYPVSLRCEEVMWREKQLFCNADFFHAPAYHLMDIPTKLFTPIFVMSRITGWTAHIIEQRANNRIIRPSAEYTGPSESKWTDINSR